ncbi:MAG: alanine--tRNA ligase, partial [Candidatus Korarchaeota archaeon]|nr:alanine--tRNA ligase [Candidatus Korarchaeota archaeon]NIU84493.1 alanine--tRNA ligase [Candidatus Thorarchaeota archaeon]NIW14560.1 alanine--tRNA ligase [Candidatus Thorarchaeota archaeon]NIW52632.1 alanine--tRNA ligase [Candidatus Korarchaeota archaeon]
TIEGKRLLNVKEEKGVVLHKLDDVSTFEEGQEVRGKIDWNTRYSLMKNHTAAHLINWAARKTLGQHVWQAGAKKAPKKARLDITHFKTLSFDTLQEIEQIANQKVQSSIEVEKRILPRTKAEETYGFRIYQGGAVPGKELRIVKTGEEVEACGGTHVDNTAEIGLIKITSSERIQDGVVRLEYVTDGKAFETIQTHEQILESLSDLWDVPYEQLYKTGKRFFNEWKARGNKIDELENEIIDLKVENALREEKRLIKVEVPGSFGKIAERSKQYIPEIENAIILIGENYGYGVSANEVD